MKRMKRVASLLLAMVMVLSMSFAAFAAFENQGTITISGTENGKTYDLYRIFDITMTENEPTTDPVTYTYTYAIATKWEAFFTNGAGSTYLEETGDGLVAVEVEDETKYLNITEDNKEAFAADALNYALTTAAITPDKSVEAAGETLMVEQLPLGHYMIFPQGSTVDDGYAAMVSVAYDAQATIKATYPTITKEDDIEDNELGVEIGDVINYTITGKVPNTTAYGDGYEYIIKDTMSDGLTLNSEVVVTVGGVTLDDEQGDYTCIVNGDSFTLDINVDDLTAGDEILVTYSAVVNANASAVVSKNSATLTYSDAQGSTATTAAVETKVFSAKILINKTNGAGQKLPGAKFILKNTADDTYYKNVDGSDVEWVTKQAEATVLTTDEDGVATFNGLKDGTYTLVETEAPEGYNKLETIPDIKIDGNTDEDITELTITTSVVNNSGALLPSTGGIGTTIFYIIGGILLVTGFVLIVTRKRMKAE